MLLKEMLLTLTSALSPAGITTLLISTALSMWGFIIHGHLCGLFFKRGRGMFDLLFGVWMP